MDWAEGLMYSQHDPQLAGWREETWDLALKRIAELHRQAPIDLFLSYLFPNQVEPEAVKKIRAMGIPCVNHFCDNVREFRVIPKVYDCFDLHWVPEKAALAMYQKAGMPYIYAPMPVWVPPEFRDWRQEEKLGATFQGSRDLLREALLADALALGAPIEISGPGWPRPGQEAPAAQPAAHGAATPPSFSLGQRLVNQLRMVRQHGLISLYAKLTYRLHKPCPDALFEGHVLPMKSGMAYLRATQQSRITIGINRYPSVRHPFHRPDAYSRLRDIEAPMIGACYLVEAAEGLEDLYEPGVEIELFRNAEELTEQIARLEADPDKRRNLRRNGMRRALAHHTVGRTLERIQKEMQL